MAGTGSPFLLAGMGSRSATSDGADGCASNGKGCHGGEGMCVGDGACSTGRSGMTREHAGFGNKLMIGRLINSAGAATLACPPPPDGFDDVMAVYDDHILGLPFHINHTMTTKAAHAAYHHLVSAMLTLDSSAGALPAASGDGVLDRSARYELGRALAVRLSRQSGSLGPALARLFDWPALHDWLLEHARSLVRGRSIRLLCRCWGEVAPQTAPPHTCHAQTLLYGLDVLAQRLVHDCSSQLPTSRAMTPIAQVRLPTRLLCNLPAAWRARTALPPTRLSGHAHAGSATARSRS
jgi:hypothetical protein